jgi:hypothetical protein
VLRYDLPKAFVFQPIRQDILAPNLRIYHHNPTAMRQTTASASQIDTVERYISCRWRITTSSDSRAIFATVFPVNIRPHG